MLSLDRNAFFLRQHRQRSLLFRLNSPPLLMSSLPTGIAIVGTPPFRAIAG
jgi:hypothetical protein